MKRFIRISTVLTLILILATGCPSKNETIDETPICIENKIASILNGEVTNPPTQIWKWEVDAKSYFYITSDCCDQFNNLYNSNCEVVCAPDGGFTGNGDGNCPTFSGEILKTLIWEDKRK